MTGGAGAAAAERALGRLAWAVGLGLFGLIVLGPLVAVLADALVAVSRDGQLLALAVPDERTAPVLLRSLALAAGVAGAAVAVAVLLVTALWRAGAGRLRRLRWLLVALAPLPAYVHALAWTAVAGELRRLLRPLGIPLGAAVGWPMAAWVSLMAALPFALLLALVALESVPRPLAEAARVARPDGTVLRRVVLPLAAPLLAMAAALLFLLAVLDYSIPTLFQVDVYSLQVFVTYSLRNQPAAALLTGLPLILVTTLVVLWIGRALGRVAQQGHRAPPFAGRPPAWPRSLGLLQGLALGMLALQLLVPLAALLLLAGPPAEVLATVASSGAETAYSLALAAVVALAGLPLALAAAQALASPGRLGRAMWVVVVLPLALPPALVGIGLITALNGPPLPLHGSAAMPVLAALARFAPWMALVLFAQLRRLDPLALDAARVFQPSPLGGWLRVRLPLMAPGLVAAAGLGFALTLGELGATLLVAPAGQGTLTMRIFNYLHFGASEGVAALCLVMVLAALAGGLVAAWAMAHMGGSAGGLDAPAEPA